jgi:hypothetical protein
MAPLERDRACLSVKCPQIAAVFEVGTLCAASHGRFIGANDRGSDDPLAARRIGNLKPLIRTV